MLGVNDNLRRQIVEDASDSDSILLPVNAGVVLVGRSFSFEEDIESIKDRGFARIVSADKHRQGINVDDGFSVVAAEVRELELPKPHDVPLALGAASAFLVRLPWSLLPDQT